MKPEILALIQTIVTALAAIAYIFTYRFMAEKLKTMQQTVESLKNNIDSQSKIISDFEKYKALFDIDDFEKRLQLKMDNQKMELTNSFNLQAKKNLDVALQKFAEHVTESTQHAMGGWKN